MKIILRKLPKINYYREEDSKLINYFFLETNINN